MSEGRKIKYPKSIANVFGFVKFLKITKIKNNYVKIPDNLE